MLLVAAMVIVPVADAFSCSFEPETMHATSLSSDHAADEAPTSPDGPTTHDICSHNHCHHTTADVPSSLLVGTVALRRNGLLPANDDQHRANRPDQLLRPPRI